MKKLNKKSDIDLSISIPAEVVTRKWNKHYIKFRVAQKTLKHQFENVYFICSIDAFMGLVLTKLSRPYLLWSILNAYSLYFVLLLNTRDSDSAVTETQQIRKGIFLFSFSHSSVVFYSTITHRISFISILINITENKVDWKICQSKTRTKYSRFPYDGKPGEMASLMRRGR